MIIICMAWLIYAIVIFFRNSRELSSGKGHLILFAICFLCDIVASIGIFCVTSTEGTTGNFSATITVIALLTAGLISGRLNIENHEADDDEGLWTASLTVLFVTLFYFLFGAIAYYSALTPQISSAPKFEYLIAIIAGLVLIINTVYEFWDYRNH